MRYCVLSLTVCVALLAAGSQALGGLIISEVIDGPLSGGNPKFVEITNTGATDYTFTGGGIVVQSNSSNDLDIDVDLTGVTIIAGDSYVIQSSANDGQNQFETLYGFAADLYTAAFFSNGDDRYILADADDGMGVATNLVDISGEIDTDGTGEPWEYLDSYAYRNPNVLVGNGGLFDNSEWTTAPPNTLDGDDGTLTKSVTTPGTHTFVPEPASALLALFGLAGVAIRRRG